MLCMHVGICMPASWVPSQPEYDIASLYMVSFYCFVTKACARRPGAAASVERRRASRSDTLAASQAFERMYILTAANQHTSDTTVQKNSALTNSASPKYV